MCDAVWQPLEDGEDTFCSKACVAAYNAKLKAEHEDGLAGVPVEDEPLPPPDFLPLRQREGEDMELDEEPEATTADQHTIHLPFQQQQQPQPPPLFTGAASIFRWPPPRTLERL